MRGRSGLEGSAISQIGEQLASHGLIQRDFERSIRIILASLDIVVFSRKRPDRSRINNILPFEVHLPDGAVVVFSKASTDFDMKKRFGECCSVFEHSNKEEEDDATIRLVSIDDPSRPALEVSTWLVLLTWHNKPVTSSISYVQWFVYEEYYLLTNVICQLRYRPYFSVEPRTPREEACEARRRTVCWSEERWHAMQQSAHRRTTQLLPPSLRTDPRFSQLVRDLRSSWRTWPLCASSFRWSMVPRGPPQNDYAFFSSRAFISSFSIANSIRYSRCVKNIILQPSISYKTFI